MSETITGDAYTGVISAGRVTVGGNVNIYPDTSGSITSTLSAVQINAQTVSANTINTTVFNFEQANVDISGNLTVGGDTILNNLVVTGSVQLDNIVIDSSGVFENIEALTATIGTLVVTGDETVNGNLMVDGEISSTSLMVSGVSIDASGNLLVPGQLSTASGFVADVSGNLIVAGNEVVGGGLSVAGNESVTKNLFVNENTAMNGGQYVDGGLYVNNGVTIGDSMMGTGLPMTADTSANAQFGVETTELNLLNSSDTSGYGQPYSNYIYDNINYVIMTTIDSSGQYVPGTDLINLYDTDNALVDNFGDSSFNYPLDLIVDPSGYIYVSNNNSNQIFVYNTSGTKVRTLTDSSMNHPAGLTYNNGMLYVASLDNVTPSASETYILILDAVTGDKVGSIEDASLAGGCVGMCVDVNNNLYASVIFLNAVNVYDPSGAKIQTISSPTPVPPRFDTNGYLYLPSFSSELINVFSISNGGADSTFVVSYPIPGAIQLGDISFDTSNNMYVVLTGNILINKYSIVETPYNQNLEIITKSLNVAGDIHMAQGSLYIDGTDETIVFPTGSATAGVHASDHFVLVKVGTATYRLLLQGPI
jgi:hypothetical protein